MFVCMCVLMLSVELNSSWPRLSLIYSLICICAKAAFMLCVSEGEYIRCWLHQLGRSRILLIDGLLIGYCIVWQDSHSRNYVVVLILWVCSCLSIRERERERERESE